MSRNSKVALNDSVTPNHSLETEVVLKLATEGANILIHSNSSKTNPELDGLMHKLELACVTVKVAFYPTDLLTAVAVERIFNDIAQQFVELDIVVKT
jgi:NAD(P)-dependent dehydrogenase (short-subunit alcohol dehydrogenase family)